ncbi:STAS domain-containing protein [Planosporangium sp. 12N6]|uniref:STAS domain-containing protein n=1 Tax=Planosporangium spinosum TaxID=3402278 RepID=UPI003CEE422B
MSGLVKTHRLIDGTMMVDVRGELDSASTETLCHGLAGDVVAAKPSRVVVDLASVTAMDDAALVALLGVQRDANRVGASLRVANPNPTVARLMATAGVAETLGCRPGDA